MKKYNLKFFWFIICLLISLVSFEMYSSYYVSETMEYENIKSEVSTDNNNLITFVPWPSSYNKLFESDIEYMDSLASDLALLGYTGYQVSPDRCYGLDPSGNSVFMFIPPEGYVLQYQGENGDFNYHADTESDITVVLPLIYSYDRGNFKIGDTINLNLIVNDGHRFEHEERDLISVSAVISGFMSNYTDNANLVAIKSNTFFISDITHLFAVNLVHNPDYQIFRLSFDNLGENKDAINAYLSEKGTIEQNGNTLNYDGHISKMPLYTLIFILSSLCISFSVGLGINLFFSIKNEYDEKGDPKMQSDKLRNGLIFLFAAFLMYLLFALLLTIAMPLEYWYLKALPIAILIFLMALIMIINLKKVKTNDRA
jgi:hypothetical protein